MKSLRGWLIGVAALAAVSVGLWRVRVEAAAPTGQYTVAASIVTDTRTGLVWQRAPGPPAIWNAALDYCENLSLAGANDWRLPNVKELATIVDELQNAPRIDQSAFPTTAPAYFWSSSPTFGNPGAAWSVDFSGGGLDPNLGVSTAHEVRCVRGG